MPHNPQCEKFEMKLLGCEILGTAARTLAPSTDFPRAAAFSTLGDTMSTLRDILSTPGMFSIPGFPYKCNCYPNDLPHIYHDIP